LPTVFLASAISSRDCSDAAICQNWFGNDRFTRGTLRFAWHKTTVAWLGFAVLLAILMAQEPLSPAQILPVIAGVFALTGALAAVFTRGRHLSWIIFFAIAGLSLLPIMCQ
jgi:tellurite resistance protein TehA-like permease